MGGSCSRVLVLPLFAMMTAEQQSKVFKDAPKGELCVLWCGGVVCCVVVWCVVLWCVVLCGVVWCCVMLCCSVLCCSLV